MRIFPEGTEEWLQPCGTAMQILACFMATIAIAAVLWRSYNLNTWHTTEGQVIDANVTRQEGDDGVTLCSAAYRIRYDAGGAPHVLSTKFSSATSNCASWETRVAKMPGSKEAVLYDPQHPDSAYVNGGKSVEFFIVSIVCGGLALAFALGGTVMKRVGRGMNQRNLAMP